MGDDNVLLRNIDMRFASDSSFNPNNAFPQHTQKE